MDSLKLLWFFVWRMVLWGACLCALVGAIYGAGLLFSGVVFLALTAEGPGDDGSVAGLVVYMVGAGAVYGTLSAVAGVALGLLCGLMLFGLTQACFRPRPADPARYRKMASWTCATVSLLALVVDWLVNGFPNPYDFGPFRLLKEPFVVQGSALDVFVLVIIPTLIFSLATWLSGRLVAARYAREVGEAGSGGRAPVGDRRPESG